jgi:hypothetical protein
VLDVATAPRLERAWDLSKRLEHFKLDQQLREVGSAVGGWAAS